MIGSCGYSGGLSVISAAGTVVRYGYPLRLCGERVAAVGDTVVIAKDLQPVPQGSPSTLVFFDRSRRQVTHAIELSTDILDVVAG